VVKKPLPTISAFVIRNSPFQAAILRHAITFLDELAEIEELTRREITHTYEMTSLLAGAFVRCFWHSVAGRQ
jgi:hypothetical protein